MNSGEPPQREEESLLLRGFEVMLYDALIGENHLSLGKRGTDGTGQDETDAVQNLDTQLGVRAFQVSDEGPALSTDQDLSQGSNGPGFVPCADYVFPELWVIFGHGLPGEVWLGRSTRGI